MAKISKTEAKRLAVKAGVDFHKDFHQLSNSQVVDLVSIAHLKGYHKPKNASGSTGRYFFAYLQKVR